MLLLCLIWLHNGTNPGGQAYGPLGRLSGRVVPGSTILLMQTWDRIAHETMPSHLLFSGPAVPQSGSQCTCRSACLCLRGMPHQQRGLLSQQSTRAIADSYRLYAESEFSSRSAWEPKSRKQLAAQQQLQYEKPITDVVHSVARASPCLAGASSTQFGSHTVPSAFNRTRSASAASLTTNGDFMSKKLSHSFTDSTDVTCQVYSVTEHFKAGQHHGRCNPTCARTKPTSYLRGGLH